MNVKQRHALADDDEHDRLVKVGDSFWHALGKLAAEHIAMMPPDLQDLTTVYLQDACSIYGTEYSKYLKERG